MYTLKKTILCFLIIFTVFLTVSLQAGALTVTDGGSALQSALNSVSGVKTIVETADTNSFIFGMLPNTEVSDFNGISGLSVLKANGSSAAGSDCIGTGMEIEYLAESSTVVLIGDIDGNGMINASDIVYIKKSLLSISGNLSTAQSAAQNINRDTTVNLLDLVTLKASIVAVQTNSLQALSIDNYNFASNDGWSDYQ